MYHDLFLQMHQSLDQINEDFSNTDDIDEELSLLEKYLSIKEISDELKTELEKIQIKINQFEIENDLTDLQLFEQQALEQIEKSSPKQGEVVIELEENDFFTLQKGIGFFDLWMYDEAIIHLEKIISKYPDFNLPRLYKAMTYYKKKEYELAKQEVQLLFQFSDDDDLNALGHNILGMVYGQLEDFDQAMNHLHKAIELHSNWNEPKFNLAMLLYRLNRIHDSIHILTELHQSNSKDWEVIYYLGKGHQKLKLYDKANEYFRKTYEITKQPAVIIQMIKYFESNRNYQQAIHWYKKWINLEPNTDALMGLAKNVWLTGKKEDGIAIIKKVLSIDSGNKEAQLIYAWMLTEGNDKKAASIIDSFEDYPEWENRFTESYLIANLARLYYLNNDAKNASRFSSMLLNSSHASIQALGNIVQGMIYLDQNLPEKALHHFLLSKTEAIQFPYLDFYLGYCHYLLGNTEQAKQAWTKLVH